MNLNLFPPTIADLERALLKQNQVVRDIKDRLEESDWTIDREIAFDSELKNDLQRRAKRAELIARTGHGRLIYDLRRAAEVARAIEIDLDLTKNQFAVAKLEARERIARLEGAA